VLVNKDTNHAVQVSINLGTNVVAAQMVELTGPALASTNGYTLGGAAIETNGFWAGGVQAGTPATNGQVTITVPPINAVLLNPVLQEGTNLMFSVTGNQLELSWPSNYSGWSLQSNATALAGSSGWFMVPGSAGTNQMQIKIEPGETNVFYRLILPP
jgi:hypothetical protein